MKDNIINQIEINSDIIKPIISVIIPTYNRGYIINRAIDSVISQTFKNIEIIIVDDNSNDNTKNLIVSYKDSRIRYLKHNINMGAQAARNTGIKNSKGDYIAFLDSDDEFLPNKLELQYNAFCNSPKKVGVIYSHAYIRDESNNDIGEFCINFKGNIYKDILKYLCIDFITPLTRRECFEKMGFLDERVPSYQEWDTFIRISKYYEFEYIPKKLAIHYHHKGERISQSILKDAIGFAYVVNKHMKAIQQECGNQELANIYFQIATKYYDAKIFKLYFSYLIKSIRYDNKKINRLFKNTLPPKIIELLWQIKPSFKKP